MAGKRTTNLRERKRPKDLLRVLDQKCFTTKKNFKSTIGGALWGMYLNFVEEGLKHIVILGVELNRLHTSNDLNINLGRDQNSLKSLMHILLNAFKA